MTTWKPSITPDDYLMHHGVKGQKWGVRRYQNYDGTLKSAGKRQYRTDKGYKKRSSTNSSAKKDANKPMSEMTNKELRQQINRMKLEQEYKDLKQKDIKRGREYVMSYVKDYATIAGALATTATIVSTAYKIKHGKF